MLRAFAAQLWSSCGRGSSTPSQRSERPLATVVQGLWEYYSQVKQRTKSLDFAVLSVRRK